MFKKIILPFSALAVMALVLSASAVSAKNDKNTDDSWVAPEKNGTYDVPGHPGLKVRVFVHPAKPDKPGKPGPSSNWLCGLNDPSGSAEVDAAGWRMEGNWIYKVNPTAPSTISANLGFIVNNSFDAWMDIPELDKAISLQYGGTTGINRAVYDGQNIIAWGKAPATALGVTYIWYRDGIALELDTIMNQKFSWNWSGGTTTCAYTNVYDAQNILTHELGHWFGLDDEYDTSYQDHTMYGYGSAWEVKKDTLTAGDITGINAIY